MNFSYKKVHFYHHHSMAIVARFALCYYCCYCGLQIKLQLPLVLVARVCAESHSSSCFLLTVIAFLKRNYQ